MVLRIIQVNIYQAINKQHISLKVTNDEAFQGKSLSKTVTEPNIFICIYMRPKTQRRETLRRWDPPTRPKTSKTPFRLTLIVLYFHVDDMTYIWLGSHTKVKIGLSLSDLAPEILGPKVGQR